MTKEIINRTANIKDRTQAIFTDEEIGPIYDGALNFDKYYKSPIKIMWLMKEAYDHDSSGYAMQDFFKEGSTSYLDKLVRSSVHPTWQPVVYTSFGILNNVRWKDMPWIREDDSIAEVLEQIAWVNINKSPSKTFTVTNSANVAAALDLTDAKKLLWDQIELLNPDIIICGNTFEFIQADLIIGKTVKKENIEYYFANGRHFINAYHPAQRVKGLTREKYCNEIIDLATDLLKSR